MILSIVLKSVGRLGWEHSELCDYDNLTDYYDMYYNSKYIKVGNMVRYVEQGGFWWESVGPGGSQQYLMVFDTCNPHWLKNFKSNDLGYESYDYIYQIITKYHRSRKIEKIIVNKC